MLFPGQEDCHGTQKIVILGAGHVGSHCAYALASAGVCEEIVLVDLCWEKAAAQALDVADSVSFMSRPVNVRSGGYAECSDASLVIVAIGEPRKSGQTRLDLLSRSVELLRVLAKQLRPLRLSCPIVTITNPADIVADYLRKSLELERWRCFSTGTLLDTARLIRLIAREAGVSTQSVQAFCLGEHGDSSMAAFSCARIGGIPLTAHRLDEVAILDGVHQAGMDIIEGKGSTEFSIGWAMCELAACILRDEKRILPVSAMLCGEYGISGVHCGVPCRIGKGGIEGIVELPLSENERTKLVASCEIIRKHIAMADAMESHISHA